VSPVPSQPSPLPAAATATPISNAPKITTGPLGIYQDFEISDLALELAVRHAWAKQHIPHYYLSVELDLSKLLKLRDSLNAGAGKEDVRLSVLDFFVKASALAMKKIPDANGAWMDTFVRRYHQVFIQSC
jgi:pyruvate dehydrogenase E2 component (dihydrolipoamide acetyltransferase)